LRLLDLVTERSLKATASITAARGRGKSAALGLTIAGAISLNFTNVYVTSPSPENLKALFEFLIKGFEALNLKEHADYEIQYSNGNEKQKCIVAINVFRNHKQTIQYIEPTDAARLIQAELLVIDEAAAIPLPLVKALISGPHMSFLSSTINGYEGTGRSLSLKLLKQLRENVPIGTGGQVAVKTHTLHEMTLDESIRYKSGDQIEKWLYKLLCLDATNSHYKLSGTPPPDRCELYYVNRDTLFSYHKASESFLSKVMSIFVSAHYKNSPDDLQMLSDAPAHHLFVLMSPVKKSHDTLPEILAAIQVCMEGQLSKDSVTDTINKGRRAAGDLIPWTVSQYFMDNNFAQLSGARIIRLAVHPDVQSMGYGSRALELLREYYEQKFLSATSNQEESLANMFNDATVDDDLSEVRSAKELPPLLCRLSERKPEYLDYIGVSFGVNLGLLKFWKRNGFVTCYMRTTTNELTGDHTCIMLKNVRATSPFSEFEKKDDWIYQYFLEFRRRFISLLSFEFKEFSPHLAISFLQLMQSHVDYTLPEKDVLSRHDIELFLTNTDFKRLSQYTRNMADHHLITDLLPTIAYLYFNDKLDSSVKLDIIQSAILLSMGLQRKTANMVAAELNLPVSQLLANFNKLIRKFTDYFDRICTTAIKKTMGEEHMIAEEVEDLGKYESMRLSLKDAFSDTPSKQDDQVDLFNPKNLLPKSSNSGNQKKNGPPTKKRRFKKN